LINQAEQFQKGLLAPFQMGRSFESGNREEAAFPKSATSSVLLKKYTIGQLVEEIPPDGRVTCSLPSGILWNNEVHSDDHQRRGEGTTKKEKELSFEKSYAKKAGFYRVA